MSHRFGIKSKKSIVALALAGVGMMPLASYAQEGAEIESVNKGRVSLSLGFDITSAYYFRGVPQENQGFIIQPYAEVGFNLYKGNDGDTVNSLDFAVGIWNSFHSGPSGTGGHMGEPEAWYEADLYAGFSATVFDKWTAGVTYTAFTGPNDAFNTIEEIAVSLAYDDSEYLGDFALSPYVLFAFEIDDEADAGNSAFGVSGTRKGVYLETGIAPSFTIVESKEFPITLTVPVVVGLSLDNYYEDGNAGDNCFGFVDVGLDFSVPLSFIPGDFGQWTLTAGPHFIYIGQNCQEIGAGVNGGDDNEIYGKIGLSMSY